MREVRVLPFLAAALFLLIPARLQAATLEEAYADYAQGRYDEARQKIQAILQTAPSPEESYKMQQDLGIRSFLEMSQNQYLQDELRKLGAQAWQFERRQFKNARRIDYYLQSYMEDDSLRAKALMNLVASGEYAMPRLIESLGSRQTDITKRGLAFQAVLRIGREAVPAMDAASFTDDPVLLVNLVRLLGEMRDLRSLPYLARLKESNKDPNVQAELAVALKRFPDISGTNASVLMIAEANRYIREDQAAVMETLTSDGILWEWDKAAGKLAAVNLLGTDFEFLPVLPRNLWPLFRAEMIHAELLEYGMGMAAPAQARASLLCCWAAQEHRVAELLQDPATARVEPIKAQLENFLAKNRARDVEVGHWTGMETLLVAVDTSQRLFPPAVSARLYKLLADFHPVGLADARVTSFVTGKPAAPALDALHHDDELVRYWAAIAIGRAAPSLAVKEQALVVDLLAQAVDEVHAQTVLLVSPVTPATDTLKQELTRLGHKVFQADTGYDGLNALREFPSKDLVILNAALAEHKNLTAVEFTARLRKDYKGRHLPLAVLCAEAQKPQVVVAYQDHAQAILVEGDGGDVLRAKLEDLRNGRQKTVFAKDATRDVCTEALLTLKGLDAPVIRSYPVLVNHLCDLVAGSYHTRDQQVLAVNVLGKFGELAVSATPVLLTRLWNGSTDLEYKMAILTTMRETSRNHPKVREALFEMLANRQAEKAMRVQAASCLGLDTKLATEEEKRKFQRNFLTRHSGTDASGM